MARPSLERNVKFKALVRALAIPKPYVRGLLETMWDVAHEYGNPVLGADTDVEAAAEWPGNPGAFFGAVKSCRLIDQRHDGHYEIHDYWDHAPEYVKGRLRKEKQRKHHLNNTDLSRDSHGTVTQKSDTPTPTPVLSEERTKDLPEAAVTGVSGLADATGAALTPKDPATDVKPRSGRKKDRVGAARPTDLASLDPAGDPVVLVFPCTGKGRDEWALRESKLREYRESYPGLDVLCECRKALQWCRDNRANRKTYGGMPAFLTRWLNRVQNRGGLAPSESKGRVTLNTYVPTEPLTPEQLQENRERLRKAREERRLP